MTKIAKYQAIVNDLRDRIVSGELAAGDLLPPRRELMATHQVARATADRAVELLKAQGLAISQGTKGVAVADISRRVAGIGDRKSSLRTTGKILAKNESSRIVSCEEVGATEEVARAFGIEPGTPVLARKRVTYKDGAPVATSTSYYSQEAAEVTPELASTERIPQGARELAAERLGFQQVEAVESVTLRLATEEEKDLLDFGSAEVPVYVMQVTRTVFLADGSVVELAIKVNGEGHSVTFHTNMRD